MSISVDQAVTATTLRGGASIDISPDGYRCSVVPPTTVNVIPVGEEWRVFPADMSGGLRGGDRVDLSMRLDEGARALWTPSASTQVFPDNESVAPVEINFAVTLENGSRLIAMNQAIIPCSGARLTQSTEINLAGDCELLWFDIWSSGREAHGERWLLDRLQNSFLLSVEDKAIYRERWTLRSDSIPEGAAGFSEFGTMWTVIWRKGKNRAWDPREPIKDHLESQNGIAEWGELGESCRILKGLTPPGYSFLPSIEDLL